MNTNQVGRIAELKVAARYISLGYKVLQPINKDGIYDFVIEREGKFQRVQVKSMQDRGDFFVLKNQSVVQNRKGTITKSYSKSEVDLLVGVDLFTDIIIQISIEEATKGGMHFRKVPPKNNQKNVKFVSDYRI